MKQLDRGWDWANRGTSHVDFSRDETIPLETGRFLGHGVNGLVHETDCDGTKLAWKKIYCRNRITPQHRKEIEIIKKLNHRHIIELVGTYTKGPHLGLLLWPVAICDLATLMEDVDYLKAESPYRASLFSHVDADILRSRCRALGYLDKLQHARARLNTCPPCIAAAIRYLHDHNIKHKDLKPSNILLFPYDGLRITDFGTSSDVSGLDSSVTTGDERGTPKYFAPEVADYKPSGRAADVFSLGCLFYEIVMIAHTTHNLIELKQMRPHHDRSFQANLHEIMAGFRTIDCGENLELQHFLCLIPAMLEVEVNMRPR
ncbi:kinase-like protein [Mytilinidion resinicola]|uniref:Kinase-like protein n=1 Tax=Mytilinidion resinicola TaxID=574789 RepID=A0A6A6Y0H5_9PEZI|nr:kinase-like protein [Mytilinidion resinicola]KAF2801725.1 kinase-like protein [Mytilinidion resinicola]